MNTVLKAIQDLGPIGTLISAVIVAVVACFSIFATTSYVDAKHDGVLKILEAHGQALQVMDTRLWELQGRPKDAPPVRMPAAGNGP